MGRTGLRLSEMGIGGWLTLGKSVDEEGSQEIVKTALEMGVNFIDTADMYADGDSERVVGEIIEEFERRKLVVSTKVYYPMSDDPNDRGLSRKHVMESIDNSLERLGTDYIDIYYCHRWDEHTPLLETMRAMTDLIQQGKLHYWGTSMWTTQQLQQAHKLADQYELHPPLVEQPRYNLVDRSIEDGVMPTAYQLGMGITNFSPLAGGLLTGKYNDGIPSGSRAEKFPEWLQEDLTEENIERTRKLTELAENKGVKPNQLALAWILTKDEITSVITGASKVKHVRQNLKAAEIEVSEHLESQIDELFS
jgi:voltage-dependent potassium channel beta subunit